MPPREHTERGFGVYAECKTSYGDVVEVQESSSAAGPFVWLRTRSDDAFITGPDRLSGGQRIAPATIHAHLSYEEAQVVVDALSEWMKDVREGRTTEGLPS